MHLTVQNLCDDLYSIIVFAPIAHMKRELLEKKSNIMFLLVLIAISLFLGCEWF